MWETSEMPTKFWSENLRKIDPLEDTGVALRVILKW
jgi:hypothetical protein